MMAFFLVMWLVGQSEKVKAGVGGYFRDPGNSEFEGGTSDTPGFPDDAGEQSEEVDELPELSGFEEQIEIERSGDRLRIELIETSKTSFFDTASPTLRGDSIRVLGPIAEVLGPLENHVVLEGHTDSRPFVGAGSYTNWELSTERANAARLVMVQQGLRPSQIRGVRGYAATLPRIPADPSNPRNRRVSIVVHAIEGKIPDLSDASDLTDLTYLSNPTDATGSTDSTNSTNSTNAAPHEPPEAPDEAPPEPAPGH